MTRAVRGDGGKNGKAVRTVKTGKGPIPRDGGEASDSLDPEITDTTDGLYRRLYELQFQSEQVAGQAS